MYKKSKNEKYFTLSKASSDWLLKIFDENNGIIQGVEESNSYRQKLAYSFDTGICAKGLMDFYSISNDSGMLRKIKELMDWLTNSVESDGTILPYMELEKKNLDKAMMFGISKKDVCI